MSDDCAETRNPVDAFSTPPEEQQQIPSLRELFDQLIRQHEELPEHRCTCGRTYRAHRGGLCHDCVEALYRAKTQPQPGTPVPAKEQPQRAPRPSQLELRQPPEKP